MSHYVQDEVDKILRLRREAKEKLERDEAEINEGASDRLDRLRGLMQHSHAGGRRSEQGASSAQRRVSGSNRKRSRTPESASDVEVPPNVITLRQAVGLPLEPAPLKTSALIIIDAQNTYTEGPLKLTGVEKALKNCEAMLKRARALGIPIFHIQHDAGAGTAYDVKGHSGAIVPLLTPRDGERVIVKNYPNSFEKTTLHQELEKLKAKNLVIVGFMTHCCVNSTARAAFNYGYSSVTVVADCTATRDLPDPSGRGVVRAQIQQRAALAAINDLHCNVVPTGAYIV